MNRDAYDGLIKRIDSSVRYSSRYAAYEVKEAAEPIRVVVTKGRSKGKIGTVARCGYVDGSKDRISFFTADNEFVSVAFTHVELADEKGEPILSIVTDTLGQEVQAGQFVAYSTTGTYGESHGLEVGKIERVTDSGNLVVMPILRSGVKEAGQYNWRTKKTKTVFGPRAIRLPVDQTLLAMHVLSDFDEFQKG